MGTSTLQIPKCARCSCPTLILEPHIIHLPYLALLGIGQIPKWRYVPVLRWSSAGNARESQISRHQV